MKTSAFSRNLVISCVIMIGAMFLSPPRATACKILPPYWIWPPHPHPPPVPPRPRPSLRPMEVREHRATLDIGSRIANVTVSALFHNPNGQRMEGTYVFPIGPDASVSSFAMTVNGKTMEAELLEAGKARKIYEDIVRKMRDPALLEYMDQGLLRARVFPIEPHADVRVSLTYETRVRREEGLCRFRYPLLSARPEGDNTISSLIIDANIETESALKTAFVPGFDVTTQKHGSRKTTLHYTASNIQPGRDFEVLFSEDARPIGVEFLGYRKGDEGYYMLVIAPDSELQAEEIAAKEITFVVDTSGSMMGEKISQARDALSFCISALCEGDHFNIISFSTDVAPFSRETLPATAANREKAQEFIHNLKARGGTAIHAAIAEALRPTPAPGTVSMIVFLTDGLPTVGETSPESIIRDAATNTAGRRIFTFGVGYDVNTRLLDGIAAKAGGYATYVRPKEDLEVSLSGFYSRISHPVMSDLRIDAGSTRLSSQAPVEAPDLFMGNQIVLMGKYTGRGSTDMVLSGNVRGTREQIRFRADLDGDPGNAFIPRMWAVRRVAYLQEQIRINGSNDELIGEIKRLGRKYGILTEFTSFLVVEEGLDREQLGEARTTLRAMEQQAAAMTTGRDAVEASINLGVMKSVAAGGATGTVAPRVSVPLSNAYRKVGLTSDRIKELVQQAGEKTFYLRRTDGYWYDSEIPAGETPSSITDITLWSDEFLELAERYPGLRKYVLLGTKLVVVIDGKTYRLQE